jgi:predicted metal-dependent hydrolase
VRALLRQLVLPLTGPVEPRRRTLLVSGRAFDVVIARHRRARRYVLRLANASTLRLTIPRGASIAGGLRFAERQHAWIDREIGRQLDRAKPWRDGTRLWFRGEQVALQVGPDGIVCGTERVALSSRRRAGRPLDAGGGSLRTIVEAHLYDVARRELPARAAELAAEHGLAVARWSVRNQRSRWGACSPRRVISLNWRLLQMPASVADYIILHELAHLRQPNHSRRFWREVGAICPWWQDAERWLRRHGKEIL